MNFEFCTAQNRQNKFAPLSISLYMFAISVYFMFISLPSPASAVGGGQVYVWNYGSFYETCSVRYLGNDASRQVCHAIMSDYFLGSWAGMSVGS